MLKKEFRDFLNSQSLINDQRAMACFLSMAIDNLLAIQNLRLGSPDKQQGCLDTVRDVPRYWREYASITVDPGRQTGKTTWVAEKATDDDIVIVTNSNMAEAFLERCMINPERVLTYRTIRSRANKSATVEPVAKFQRCYIVDAGFISSNDIEQIYKNLAQHYPVEEALSCRFFKI